MKFATILLVAWFLAGPMATIPVFADEKALQRAMEQQRRAAEAEMRKQAEYEKKMMESQRRMMQEQAKAEQHYMEMQRKAMQEQQRAMQNQQRAMQNQQNTAAHAQVKPAHVTTTATATPVYHAARPYYGHHSTRHAYHRTTYRNYRTTNQADPETLALMRLKRSLDSVPMGSTVTANHTTAIKKALMGVVEVPRVPTIASIQTLAGHLAEGMANRTSSKAQTGPMALTLRAAMNSPMLANNELVEIMNEHRAALRASKFRPTEVTAVMESLKTISNQERAQR